MSHGKKSQKNDNFDKNFAKNLEIFNIYGIIIL